MVSKTVWYSGSFFCAVFLVGLVVGLVSVLPVNAQSSPVSGWAWSSNIGWISLNCSDTGSCGTVDYSVDIDTTTGEFSGYAWSSSLGWVRFDPVGSYPEAPNYAACLNLTGSGHTCDAASTNSITGWIRACEGAVNPTTCSGATSTVSGGWDGWIKLGDPAYPLNWDPATGDVIAPAWGWGGDVVGWVGFDDLAGSGGIVINIEPPPVAVIACTIGGTPASPCRTWKSSAGFNPIVTLENNSIFEGTGELSSSWTGITPTRACPPTMPLTPCDYALVDLSIPTGTYNVTLEVTTPDMQTDSTVFNNVEVFQDIESDFGCSADGILFVDCETMAPPAIDTPFYVQNTATSSQGGTLTSCDWTFQNAIPASLSDCTTVPIEVTFIANGQQQITMQATDTNTRVGTKQITFQVALPFPERIEISPF